MSSRKLFTVRELLAATGGTLVSRDTPVTRSSRFVSSVAVDSRRVTAGSLFVALPGERTDGHNFLARAAAQGALVLLIEERSLASYYLQNLQHTGVSVISVPDTLTALQTLARSWVDRFPSLTRLAVTGSSGKTTTKEMLSSILSRMGSTVKNPGNYNSQIGLPLAVFNIEDHHEFGVFEMGINHPGEMDRMLGVYSPDVSIMTNIGTAHIGLMGSTEAIAREKSKIFHDRLQYGFIHEENIWRPYIEHKRNLRLRPFGFGATAGLEQVRSLGLDGWRITYEGVDIHLRHVGRHNLTDALAAIEAARSLGAGAGEIREGLEQLTTLEGRSRIIHGPVTVIEDSYNSNLESAGRILDYVEGLPWQGRKHVVLGSMKELGAAAGRAHTLLGRRVADLSPQGAFLFGSEMESAYTYLKNEAYANKLHFTDDYEELEHQVTSYVKEGDLVLLKGSRSMEMERLVHPLRLVS